MNSDDLMELTNSITHLYRLVNQAIIHSEDLERKIQSLKYCIPDSQLSDRRKSILLSDNHQTIH